MLTERYAIYIDGLVNMASSCSKTIGLSYMTADCYDKDSYLEDFSKFYEIPIQEIKIHEIDVSLEKLFIMLFGNDKKLIEGLLYWIGRKVGNPRKIYTEDKNSKLTNLLSGEEDGLSGFYFLERIYFVEFDKVMAVFFIGNNE